MGRSGSQVGTTANIQVYDDHLLVKEDANIATPTLPMRFLDVEGADAIPPQDEGEDDLKKRCDDTCQALAYQILTSCVEWIVSTTFPDYAT